MTKIDPDGRIVDAKRPHGRPTERPATGRADLQ
jgi:hypothetical protein